MLPGRFRKLPTPAERRPHTLITPLRHLAAIIMSSAPSVPLLLDGGLACHLEALHGPLHPTLWTAGLLLSEGGAAQLQRAHEAFVDSGAQAVISASYQATPELLQREIEKGVSSAEVRLCVCRETKRRRGESERERESRIKTRRSSSLSPFFAPLKGAADSHAAAVAALETAATAAHEARRCLDGAAATEALFRSLQARLSSPFTAPPLLYLLRPWLKHASPTHPMRPPSPSQWPLVAGKGPRWRARAGLWQCGLLRRRPCRWLRVPRRLGTAATDVH